MSTAFEHVVVEALDPVAQARWWADALGWQTSYQDEDEVDIDAPADAPPMRLVFVPVPRLSSGRQRLHLDLASQSDAHQRELVDRLLAAGARLADVGQRDVPWEVLADPEGTVFCVLEPRPVYADAGAAAARATAGGRGGPAARAGRHAARRGPGGRAVAGPGRPRGQPALRPVDAGFRGRGMTGRRNVSSASAFEDAVGYSRAVRAGDHVWVSGTTAADPDGGPPVGGDDPHAQTMEALRRVTAALAEVGATAADVVRTRMFVTDIARWPEVARAHAEVFGEVRPAATMVEVSRLIAPGLLVEVEAEAWVGTAPRCPPR